jgi:hypothetical protein
MRRYVIAALIGSGDASSKAIPIVPEGTNWARQMLRSH